MAVPQDWRRRVEESVKPYGKCSWHAEVLRLARDELSRRDNAKVLEVGCGRNCWISGTLREEGLRFYVAGIDVDTVCLNNPDVDEAIVTSATELGLDDESIDLAMAGWVFEHIGNPKAALDEAYRVLKPDGALILWTPNIWNPAMVLSAVTPTSFHAMVRRICLGSTWPDTTPTYYRINTLAKIRHLAREAGFDYESGRPFSEAYFYFQLCKPVFVAACVVNKVATIWPLSRAGLALVCVLRKPEALRSPAAPLEG